MLLLVAVEIEVWSVYRWLLVCPGCDVSSGTTSTLVVFDAGVVTTMFTGAVNGSVVAGRSEKVLLL